MKINYLLHFTPLATSLCQHANQRFWATHQKKKIRLETFSFQPNKLSPVASI